MALSNITANAYSSSVIAAMASELVAVLQPVCSVLAPNPLSFIHALPQEMQLDDPFNQYMSYGAESCLMHLSIVTTFKPSIIAGVAIVLAQRSLSLGPAPLPVTIDAIHEDKSSYKQHRQYQPWNTDEIMQYTRYSLLELKPCMEAVRVFMEVKHPQYQSNDMKAVKHKYSRILHDFALYPLLFPDESAYTPTPTPGTHVFVDERLSISSMDIEG